jgi:hypothetical protein
LFFNLKLKVECSSLLSSLIITKNAFLSGNLIIFASDISVDLSSITILSRSSMKPTNSVSKRI